MDLRRYVNNPIRRFRNFIRFHWWNITFEQLDSFCCGNYINQWQFKWLAKVKFKTYK